MSRLLKALELLIPSILGAAATIYVYHQLIGPDCPNWTVYPDVAVKQLPVYNEPTLFVVCNNSIHKFRNVVMTKEEGIFSIKSLDGITDISYDGSCHPIFVDPYGKSL